jgi:hypothetical protein
MSQLLDALCGAARLAEIARNEAAMCIVVLDTPSLTVTEEWRYAPQVSMESCGVDE